MTRKWIRLQALLLSLLLLFPLTAAAQDSAFETALAGDKLSLSPLSLDITVSAADYQAQVAAYTQAMHALDDEATTQALDDLFLAGDPMRLPLDDLYRKADFLQLSTNGKVLLAVVDQLPFAYAFDTSRFTLLRPHEISADYYKLYQKILYGGLEDTALNWSWDGSYALFTFPHFLMQMGYLGSNLLLMDLKEGTVRPLIRDLPANAHMRSMDYADGFPIKAAFDPEKPQIHVEMFAAQTPEGKENRLVSLNLETGAMEILGRTAMGSATMDGKLMHTSLGLLRSYAAMQRSGDWGLTFHRLRQGEERLLRNPEAPYEGNLTRLDLWDVKGSRILMMAHSDSQKSFLSQVHLFDMKALDSKAFAQGLAIAPEAPPSERLLLLDMNALYDKDLKALVPPPEPVMLVQNAALSLNGEYLLMMAKPKEGPNRLYIHNFKTGNTGEVRTDQAGLDENAQWGAPIFRIKTQQGLRWQAGNRLMVSQDNAYRFFQLDPAP